MIALSVNLNKIALIRNSRQGNNPDLLEHAKTCVDYGANGITIHPRPDMRHIRPDDAIKLGRFCKQYKNIEFNIEGNPFSHAKDEYPGFMHLAQTCKPHQCTLVPDSESQLTSDHGFDLKQSAQALKPVIDQLKSDGIRVSLFMDPDKEQITRAAEMGVDRIELYTGPFAEAFQKHGNSQQTHDCYMRYAEAAIHANSLGLGVNAGHDLNLDNLTLFRQLPHLQEVSIGHALIIDAIRIGLSNAVINYLKALRNE